MGVMLQAFFWDCPRVDNKEFQWWNYVCEQVPSLAKVGFTSLWLPPVHKAANLVGPSMGYDPYDYYDLGEFDQKGQYPDLVRDQGRTAETHRNGTQPRAESDRRHGPESQLGRGCAGSQSHHESIALDSVQSEEWKISAQLGIVSSEHV